MPERSRTWRRRIPSRIRNHFGPSPFAGASNPSRGRSCTRGCWSSLAKGLSSVRFRCGTRSSRSCSTTIKSVLPCAPSSMRRLPGPPSGSSTTSSRTNSPLLEVPRPGQPWETRWIAFQNGVIAPLTRDMLGDSPRVFSTVVEWLREDRQLPEGFVAHRDAMLGAVKGYVEKYHGTPASPLAPPSVSVIRSDLGRDFVRHHLRDLVADGLPMTTAEEAHRLAVTSIESETWASAGIPGLGAWSDVFASRVHRGGKVDSTKKRRGEAFDLCHMAALAYADAFLMEKKFAAIGERAARVSGTALVNAPGDLLVALESVRAAHAALIDSHRVGRRGMMMYGGWACGPERPSGESRRRSHRSVSSWAHRGVSSWAHRAGVEQFRPLHAASPRSSVVRWQHVVQTLCQVRGQARACAR